MKRIYLDHTATTPLDPRVFEAMQPYFSDAFGNASSVHWYGRQAKTALEQSRHTIAAAINAEPGEVFFTSGGTESDNFAIKGVARVLQQRKRRIVTSPIEHHAVLEPCEELQKEGFEVVSVPVNEDGRLNIDEIEQSITSDTAVVSIMHGNNEIGAINPIAQIADVCHAKGTTFHTDAVQTVGKVPVDVKTLGVDLMSFSAHKMYGPKGIGALYVRKGTEIKSIFQGGGQERGRRPGTENVPFAVGFAEALELAIAEMPGESARVARLRDMLEQRVCDQFPAAIINGAIGERLPHILNVSFDSKKVAIEGDMLVMNMDLRGIAVTSGSACTSGSMQPSHVLLAMGRDERTAKATLRFAFGKSNAEGDVAYVIESLNDILRQMKPA